MNLRYLLRQIADLLPDLLRVARSGRQLQLVLKILQGLSEALHL